MGRRAGFYHIQLQYSCTAVQAKKRLYSADLESTDQKKKAQMHFAGIRPRMQCTVLFLQSKTYGRDRLLNIFEKPLSHKLKCAYELLTSARRRT